MFDRVLNTFSPCFWQSKAIYLSNKESDDNDKEFHLANFSENIDRTSQNKTST